MYQIQHINDTIHEVYRLIPIGTERGSIRPWVSGRVRQQRYVSLCNFCGKMQKIFQGTATMDDIEALQDVFKKATNLANQRFAGIEKVINQFSSYVKLNDEKIQLLTNVVKDVTDMQSVLSQIETQNALSIRTLTALSLSLGEYVTKISRLLRLHSAGRLLSQGILTTDILPLKQADNILRHIREHVSEQSSLHLFDSDDSSIFYNKHSPVFAYRIGYHLHVVIKLRLSPFTHPLEVFQIENFLLPITDSSHSSQITNLPKFFCHK